MRRRLVIVALGTSALIVISLLVPLGLTVKNQAEDAARLEAERNAQSTAALVALALTIDPTGAELRPSELQLREGVVVSLPGGELLGQPLEGQGSLVEQARISQSTITGLVDGGWEIAVPVVGSESTVIVDALADSERLTEGVSVAWLLLAGIGLVLVALAIWVADRLGRSMVAPIQEMAAAAEELGQGDLSARVYLDENDQPPAEIEDLAETFNSLAGRLDDLLDEEREAVADLSHRLRTPLTSLRLQAESLDDGEERSEMLRSVDKMADAVDELIASSRERPNRQHIECDLDEISGMRVAFWRVLADNQAREMTTKLGAEDAMIRLAPDELEEIIDSLVGNVFAHTPAGTSFSYSTGVDGGRPWLEVADAGPGFGVSQVVSRGRSGGGSTGLGLDIAAKNATKAGGELQANGRSGVGGATVRVWLGPG